MLLENDLYPEDVRVRYEAESLVANGYAVCVIAPRGPGQRRREDVRGVEVKRFWLPLEHSGRRHHLVGEYLVGHLQLWGRGTLEVMRGADVIHVHNPPDTLFPPALLSRRTRLVFDQHDLFPELFAEKFGGGPLLAAARLAQRVTVRLADLTLATNESQRESAIAAGALPERVVVVRNAISLEEHGGGRPTRPGVLDDLHLVYVGAMGPQDGIAELAEIFHMLVAEHGLAGARMTVIGFGEEKQPLEQRLSAFGLGGQVTLTGRIDHARVLELVSEADVCIDPAPCSDLNHRTTMVKIVEYLSLGRPTVAYALRETSRTAGDAAVLAPCGDRARFVAAIVAFARSPELRDEYAARARRRASDLGWESSEKALLEGYARLFPMSVRDR
jgi:glycosyltransferase involved in cell wall biosynthesis